MNPFNVVPRTRFITNLIGPAVGVFVISVIAMGIIADPQTFVPKPVKSTGVVHAELPRDLQTATRGGINHWRTIFFFATHVPEVCWGDNAVNDFQKGQCDEFWNHLAMGGALCLLPFAATWLFMQISMGSLSTVYRRGRKRVDSGKVMAVGVVTSPARAPADFFSRFYCMQPISVQLQSGKQLKVYLAEDASEPSPGMTMAIFEPLSIMGEARHFAVLYAPHVAVVSGVRHA
jgi:hypothetical protein